MKEELLDRFGEIPVSVENLLRIALIRRQAHELYLAEVRGKNEELTFLFTANAPVRIERLPELLAGFGSKMTFHAKGDPCLRYRYKKCGVVEKDAEMLLSLTEHILRSMKVFLLK